ncbi:RagB/SusD family nutrient uptake outer membrane protein [Pedobacter sp. MC2016-14]|uniref:RagB/SusD family nutrient uptake outer membrane protein n=1 Tax=Pedobacter sp. MC2016-14 TaxID=2897327 RepID=UPI001E6438EE|nr:RagB/SusD family nutrient uptake outer membrane protein [Pedobacter sp. MC2016-14]MCD0486698.1 RagB/SusD family nutrient uptake outer membrane protein [Pedobacter sp. MC2016-14]
MKKIFVISFLALLVSLTSCRKWLDVKPENQKTTEEQFGSYSGFADALNGVYIKLKNRNIYGEKLTMTNIESLAQLWHLTGTTRLDDNELSLFTYADANLDLSANARNSISQIWLGLYNTIANANMIINNMPLHGSVINDPAKRSVILGEALAIRAFCHLDVLRLFGQLPKNATKQVSLPYAESVSTSDLPTYYNYAQFVAKIEADLLAAEQLLDKNDPIFSNTFAELNTLATGVQDDFMRFRQNRFNYWAVKGLQARFYLYIGNTAKAYTIAKSIINATGPTSNKVITLSSQEDFALGYLTSPSESLMMLHVVNLADYVSTVFGPDALSRVGTFNVSLNTAKLTTLYAGIPTVANNGRYQKLWNVTTTNQAGTTLPTLKKYNQDAAVGTLPVNVTKRQVIPLIRLSEMYLIVMETTTDLAEANALYQQYQLSHDATSGILFPTLDAVKTGVINEYRREFYAEGQMFYTYKRLGATTMLNRTGAVTEAHYILPIPMTEFNPK